MLTTNEVSTMPTQTTSSEALNPMNPLNNDLMLVASLLQDTVAKRPGPKGDKIKVFAKGHPGGKKYWHQKRKGEKPRSTGIEVVEGTTADQVRNLLTTQEMAVQKGHLAPRDVPISAAVAHWIANNRPTADMSGSAHKRYNDALFKFTMVLAFFHGKTWGDLNSAATKAYGDWRTGKTVAGHGPCPKTCGSLSTVHGDLSYLDAAIEGLAAEKQYPWRPQFWIPTKEGNREVWLTRQQVARLIWAIRGRQWDRVMDRWLTKQEADPDTGEVRTVLDVRKPEVIKARRILFRLLMIGLFTGTRHKVMLNLRWTPHAEHGCFDLVQGIIHRNGHSRNPSKGKKRASSYVPRNLLRWLRRWHAADQMAGIDCVIHKEGGGAYRGDLLDQFKAIVEDAGLDEDVVVHTLRHTCCTWLQLLRVDVQSAAAMVGMSAKTLLRVYGQWSIESSRWAADAMSSRANLRKRVRGPDASAPAKPAREPPELGRVLDATAVAPRRERSMETRRRNSVALRKVWGGKKTGRPSTAA
jgi:integrase